MFHRLTAFPFLEIIKYENAKNRLFIRVINIRSVNCSRIIFRRERACCMFQVVPSHRFDRLNDTPGK